MKTKFRFTMESVEAVPFEDKKQKVYRDTEQPNFLLVVGTKSKSYVVQFEKPRTAAYPSQVRSYAIIRVYGDKSRELTLALSAIAAIVCVEE